MEIFLARGGTRTPAKGVAASRKVISTAFSAVQTACDLINALATSP